MGFLSWAAYDYSYDVQVQSGEADSTSEYTQHVNVSAQQNLQGSSWTALGWSDLNPSGISNPLPANSFDLDGFYVNSPAAALITIKGDTIAVAIRGANEP